MPLFDLHLMMNQDLEGAFFFSFLFYLDLFSMSETQPGVNGGK